MFTHLARLDMLERLFCTVHVPILLLKYFCKKIDIANNIYTASFVALFKCK